MSIGRCLRGVAFLLILANAAAAQYSPLKVVETGVNYPGAGTFTAFGGPPVSCSPGCSPFRREA